MLKLFVNFFDIIHRLNSVYIFAILFIGFCGVFQFYFLFENRILLVTWTENSSFEQDNGKNLAQLDFPALKVSKLYANDRLVEVVSSQMLTKKIAITTMDYRFFPLLPPTTTISSNNSLTLFGFKCRDRAVIRTNRPKTKK